MWRVKSLDAILATAEKKSLHRSLGAVQLTLLGVGAIIGTGIFVLTAEAAQKAGPGMMLSFVLAGAVCAVAALCYSEFAAMAPVSGSAYTYTYSVMGEFLAWLVGWALVLEYAIAGAAVSVGWSGYFQGQLQGWLGIGLPAWASGGFFGGGGIINLPATLIAIAVTGLLILGTTESARVNAVLVAIKVAALSLFVILAIPAMNMDNFEPFLPTGVSAAGGLGVAGAAASIFFAYVGFDAVSTASEETKNPQRNVPIGLIGSLLICTVFYMLVAAGVIGSPLGAQPVTDAAGAVLAPGSQALADRCASLAAIGQEPVSCSKEALAHVLREMGHPNIGNLIGLAAMLALPSVILMMIYGQTRIFFVMARDGLLPNALSKVHHKYKTPHVVTIITGVLVTIAAAFFPVGKLADIANSGTLFAFFMVAIGVMILRKKDPHRRRPFRTPALWLIAPLTVAGCLYLFFNLPLDAKLVLPIWSAIGLVLYFGYGFWHSHMRHGVVEVPELDPDAPQVPVPPMPGAPTPGQDNG